MLCTSETHCASQAVWQQYESAAQIVVTQGSQADFSVPPCVQSACEQLAGGDPPPGVEPPGCAAICEAIQLETRSTRASTSVPPPAPEFTATIVCGAEPTRKSGPPESPDSMISVAT